MVCRHAAWGDLQGQWAVAVVSYPARARRRHYALRVCTVVSGQNPVGVGLESTWERPIRIFANPPLVLAPRYRQLDEHGR